jgi:hypothetical protein
MAGGGENIERYDSVVGGGVVDGVERLLVEFDRVEFPATPSADGGGAAFAEFVASLGRFETAVNDRLAEQRQIGQLVVAMLSGVHHRIDGDV